jgi:hypothetical protein
MFGPSANVIVYLYLFGVAVLSEKGSFTDNGFIDDTS